MGWGGGGLGSLAGERNEKQKIMTLCLIVIEAWYLDYWRNENFKEKYNKTVLNKWGNKISCL